VPLEKDGKIIIEQINFQKNLVVIIFSNGEKLSISPSCYTQFYLYPKKELSHQELIEIKKENNFSLLKDYALNLLNKKMYSQKELENKLLKEKNCSKEEIESLISFLNQHHYLDDKKLADDLTLALLNKKNGSNKIINKLSSRGISPQIIAQIEFDQSLEISNMIYLLKKYLVKKEKSVNELKTASYNYLLRQGYREDLIKKVIDEHQDLFNKINESDILIKEKEKYLKLHHLNLDNNEDKQKIIAYLLRKGYKYNDINQVLKGD
jgi:regulatory protein